MDLKERTPPRDRFPLVSILIPNFNYARFVPDAVASAVAQTYPNVEVIVSDNASTDGAWEILTERFGSDPRVQLYRHERNVGMIANFNGVLDRARGDYHLWLSSDDFLMHDHVERLMVPHLADPGLDVVYCTAYFANEEGKIFGLRSLPGQFPVDYVDARDELVENFTSVCPVCFPCALFKRESVVRERLFDEPENATLARDWEVIMQMALAGFRFAYVARPSMAIRSHGEQSSGRDYHATGQNVTDFAAYVRRFMDHPEFVRRMHGHEREVARFVRILVNQAPHLNDGTTPFDAPALEGFERLARELEERAERYNAAAASAATVTVIIESVGAPSALLRAIDSVAAQTWTAWEIVVVDHGTIPVEAILHSHPMSKRISYVRLPALTTPGAVRQLALRMARGEYVTFLAQDDVFTPEHLRVAIDTIMQTGAEIAMSEARLILERGDGAAANVQRIAICEEYGGSTADLESLPVAHSVPLGSLVIWRGVFDRIGGFNETAPLLDDWDFALRASRLARIAPTGETTLEVVYRLGLAAQRLSSGLKVYLSTLDSIYGAHAPEGEHAMRRVHHRAAVAKALESANDWIGERHGLMAFLNILSGHEVVPA